MRTGSFRKRITFQSKSRVKDAGGGRVNTWANVASAPTVWASVTQESATEGTEADQTQAKATIEINTYYRSDITEAMRVVWKSVNYNIRTIAPDDREMFMLITAQRGVAD